MAFAENLKHLPSVENIEKLEAVPALYFPL